MHIAILGNGISGITAARFIRKLSDHKITVISAETDHFFSRTALMYIYMGHMRFKDTQPYEPFFWKKNRIELRNAYVEKIDSGNKKLHLKGGESLSYDKLIIATGSKPNKFGWPGQDLKNVNGLYSYQDLEAMEAASDGLNRAVIVGGGLIGLEMAEMFMSRNIPVTFLVRETNYWNIVLPEPESKMVSNHIFEHGIDLKLGTELKEIVDDGTGKAGAVITNKGERIECGYVGLTAGVSPNISFLEGSAIETGRGIIVNEFLETNVPDVYAIGDCSQHSSPKPGRRPIEAIWYTGRMMGETLAHTVCGNKTEYDPGIWFNSAKFLDIEYQVYGTVDTILPDEQTSIYWEHASGKKSIRIVYDRDEKYILGFNLMGVRYRHEVCEKWIKAKTPIEEVLSNLSLANFDPEFFEEYEQGILDIYEQQSGKKLALEKKRSSNAVMQFLGF
jgi:NADPH-dependent 2,4-dienoyl-CoA reductase/sulfur reductase-like enzyme